MSEEKHNDVGSGLPAGLTADEEEFMKANLIDSPLHTGLNEGGFSAYVATNRRAKGGFIPDDWPDPVVRIHAANPGDESSEDDILVPADWATWVLWLAVTKSKDADSIGALMPKSYDDVSHQVWEPKPNMFLAWNPQSQEAALVMGERKEAAKHMLTLQQHLHINHNEHRTAENLTLLTDYIHAFRKAMQKHCPEILSSDKWMDSIRSVTGMNDATIASVPVLVDCIRSRLLTMQGNGFRLERGVCVVENPDGQAQNVFVLVLVHMDEFAHAQDRVWLRDLMRDHVTRVHELKVLTVIEGPGLQTSFSEDQWYGVPVSRWVLSSVAAGMVTRLSKRQQEEDHAG